MKLLYFGTLEWGSSSLYRMETIRSLVDHVYSVDMRIMIDNHLNRSNWIKIQQRLGYGPLISKINATIINEVRRYQPDVVWIDQGINISNKALQKIKDITSALLVHYTPDTLNAPGWKNRCFLNAVSQYDLCITTKEFDIESYYKMGARNVLLTSKYFHPKIHRPLKLNTDDLKKYSCDVVFVGTRMEERARSICNLMENFEGKIYLYGKNWKRGKTGAKLGILSRGWVDGEEYVKALIGAKICLGFLARNIGDIYTCRSIEIPACGGFLLAQRTVKHLELFQEDIEAVFFDDDVEMIEKVNFYIRHPELRLKIAKAGHDKVKRLNITIHEIMKSCINTINKMLIKQ